MLAGIEPLRAWVGPAGGGVDLPAFELLTPSLVHLRLMVLLAGRAAEISVLGDAGCGGGLGRDSDLAQATDLAWRSLAQLGFGATLSWVAERPNGIDPRVEAMLSTAQDEAMAIARHHRATIERVARALMAQREIDAAGLRELVKQEKAKARRKRPKDDSAVILPFPGAH